MSIYEDIMFDEQFADDTQEVTCRMCQDDCPLSLIKSGLCPACVSLCASAPIKRVDPYTRRACFVSLTRKALVSYTQAQNLYLHRKTAPRPSPPCIHEAALLHDHRLARYNGLLKQLALECGMGRLDVFCQLDAFPDCTRLLTANL